MIIITNFNLNVIVFTRLGPRRPFFFQVRTFQTAVGAPDQFNSVLFGGLIGSLFSFLQFVASPVVGGLSDHYGRRPMLLFTAAGVALSYGVWAVAGSFGVFVLARVIGGLAKVRQNKEQMPTYRTYITPTGEAQKNSIL